MSAEGLVQGPARSPGAGVRPPDVYLYGALFAAAVGAFCLASLIGPRLGLASDLVAVAGDATCGWSWLLVRALFQPPDARRTPWPLVLVLFLVAAGAFLRLPVDAASALPRMVENLSGLVSSSLLLLAAIEPLRGLASNPPRAERLFRIGFVLGYGAILALAVVWVNGAPAGGWVAQWKLPIKAACAVVAMLGMGFAIWYRRRHPLAEAGRPRRRARSDEGGELGDRLIRLMTDEAIYARPSLKVADLARRLGEAEYRVTQAITGPLGFRNFNQMANHFRIEEAKRRLADPAFDALPILTIAYDCGFGSIGPFNRAFKALTGVTPNEFRRLGRPHPRPR
jgi:AraC-like DNA-binding protein